MKHSLERRGLSIGIALVAGAGFLSCGQHQSEASGPVAKGIPIGEWQDTPGACPPAAPHVDLSTSQDLEDASRGEGKHASDPPDTCYLIKNGTYRQGKELLLFVRRGGREGAPRRFIGESRAGVVLHGRATVDDRVAHVVLQNLTFDLNGYSQDGSFNTITLGQAQDVVLDHLTLTGDCRTGRRGGHIETNGTDGVRVSSCLIERFGRCGPEGHEEHGIYLASGRNIEIRNSVIRENASRGIQLYTAGGEYGTLSKIRILGNRIYGNGHADYEDGIVITGTSKGTIQDVQILGNLLYDNYYSGVRFAGGATSGIVVKTNTFYENGRRSGHGSRSEINSDGPGAAAGAVIERNIFWANNRVINNCYDAAQHDFGLKDNVVHGRIAPLLRGGCVTDSTEIDPGFADPEAGDFRPREAGAAAFGAYAWSE